MKKHFIAEVNHKGMDVDPDYLGWGEQYDCGHKHRTRKAAQKCIKKNAIAGINVTGIAFTAAANWEFAAHVKQIGR